MAAGNFTVFNIAKPKLADGVFDLDSNDFRLVLCTNAQALTAAFAGTSTDAQYSDLTGEVSGAAPGYDTGGEPLPNVTWTRASGVVTFAADPTTWTAATFVAKYAVVVKSDGASPPTLSDLLGFVDLETTDAAGRTSAGGDFQVAWPTGIFTLT
jgi:hypothetical protein